MDVDKIRHARSLYEVVAFGAVDQLDGAVMTDPQFLRQGADSRPGIFRQAFERQQQLILLRFDAGCGGRLIAELQIATDVVAKLRQSPVVRVFYVVLRRAELFSHCWADIVPRYSAYRKVFPTWHTDPVTESKCDNCGRPLVSDRCEYCDVNVVFRIVRREVWLLILLGALVVPLFVFTRSMAARNRSMNIEIAGSWHQLGQQRLKAGDTEQAVEDFRKATTRDHDNADYALDLAAALSAANRTEEARQDLLRLREASPESGEINLNLARLFAKEGDEKEAIRYYHHALFGMWPEEPDAGQRADVRLELIRFLLDSGESSQALSELLILASDLPDNEKSHIEVGELFLQAGDPQRALDQYTVALKANAKDPGALGGAGRAAFKLGDYAGARRYLDGALANGGDSAEVRDVLEIARLVLSADPLAVGIGMEARIRRLKDDLDFSMVELQACISERPAQRAAMELLSTEMTDNMKTTFSPAALRRDSEGLTAGLNLIQRIETATGQNCGKSSPFRTALLLIARKHGVLE